MPHLMGTESFAQEGVINSDSDNAGIYSLTRKDGCVFFLAGVLHTLCGLLRCLSGKESACSAGHVGSGSFHPWVGKIPWRRKWQPTPIFLPEKSHGQRSLMGYRPWGRKSVGHKRACTHSTGYAGSDLTRD